MGRARVECSGHSGVSCGGSHRIEQVTPLGLPRRLRLARDSKVPRHVANCLPILGTLLQPGGGTLCSGVCTLRQAPRGQKTDAEATEESLLDWETAH